MILQEKCCVPVKKIVPPTMRWIQIEEGIEAVVLEQQEQLFFCFLNICIYFIHMFHGGTFVNKINLFLKPCQVS